MYDKLCMRLVIFTCVMILTWNGSSVSSLVVYRETRDSTANFMPCMDSHASKVKAGDCTCDADYNTVMSRDESEYYCLQPWYIQCYYSLLETKQTYLIGHNSTNDTAQIIKSGSKEIDAFQLITQISLWNYHSVGNWYDITELAKPYFKLDDNEFGGNNLTVVNLNTTLWQGHLLRFNLEYKKKNYEPCLTLKVQGKRYYPFDFDEFRSHLALRKTTTKPTVETTTFKKPTTNVTITTTIAPLTATTKTITLRKTTTSSSNSTTSAPTETRTLKSTNRTITTFNATTTKATHTNKTTQQTTTQALTSSPSTSNSTDLTTHRSTEKSTKPITSTVTTVSYNTTNRPKTAAYVSDETTSNWKYYVLCGFSICCVIIILVLVYMMKKRRKFESVDFELPKHVRLSVCKESFENPTYEAADENNDKVVIADCFDNPTYDEVAKENNEMTVDDSFDDLTYNAEEKDDNKKGEGFESPTYDAVAPPDYIMMGEGKQCESDKKDDDNDNEFTINL